MWKFLKPSPKNKESLDHSPEEFVYSSKEVEMISTLTKKVLSSLDPDVLFQESIDNLVVEYDLMGAILLLIEGDYLYAKTISAGPASTRFLNLINVPISDLKTKIYKDSPNAIVKSILQKESIESDLLLPFTKDVIPDNVINVAQRLTGAKFAISMPIIYKDDSIGSLFISKKVPQGFKKQLPILKVISELFGIAIVNARLFDENQNKIDELNALRRREQDMMDIMGHELRTPLSIMRISLGLLTERYSRSKNKDVKCDEYITRMKDALDREVRLLETMLNSTKIEANKIELRLEKVDLDRIIKDTMLALGSKAQKKSLQFIYNPLPSGNYVYADSVRLGEVIDNLVLNAIKYTEKGSVTISLKEVDKGIEVSISDTGIGIPKEDIKHLGEKFYRVGQYSNNVADRTVRKKLEESQPTLVRPGGTGLGLYVSFNLVELMGGKVKVTSTVGKGSTFSFVIPKYYKQPDTHSNQKVEKNIFSRLGFTHKQS